MGMGSVSRSRVGVSGSGNRDTGGGIGKRTRHCEEGVARRGNPVDLPGGPDGTGRNTLGIATACGLAMTWRGRARGALGEELFPPRRRGCAWANLYWRKWEHGPAWVLG